MVMHLPQPEACSLGLLDAVIEERQGGANAAFFNEIASEWRERVVAYIAHAGSPEHVPKWSQIEPRRQTFLNLYSSGQKGAVQKAVIARMRREHGLNHCPACGELGTPNTLDHYLPKRLYPHFCVTPLNLFPMCDACQEKKREKTGDVDSPRFFIHPYFDVFVGEQVIELQLRPPYDAPGFTLLPREGLPEYHEYLVSTHMRELAMGERYLRYFRGQYLRLLRMVQNLRDQEQDVRANLETFRLGCAAWGSNVWDHVFYAAVLGNEEMMEYLESEQLPGHL